MSALPPVITIDGPAASGKSSIARRVAQHLGFTYVNTGNMYRAMTWAVLQAGVDPQDADAVRDAAAAVTLESPAVEGKTQVRVSGSTLGDDDLNSDPVNRAVSLVAKASDGAASVPGCYRAFLAKRDSLHHSAILPIPWQSAAHTSRSHTAW